MPGDIVIAGERDLRTVLAPIAQAQRMVFFAGLPGVGKSLLVRELARAAHDAGRPVHLLQWDVVRLAFEPPAMAARYPERDGVTHAVIRKAVGLWARQAVSGWHHAHASTHLLIGEVPIIGHRLLELVQRQDDAAEALLAGEASLFITPVPSAAVRGVIADVRRRTVANPSHARERGDAPPALMQAAWDEIRALAASIDDGPPAPPGAPYDPRAYAAAYRHLLRHRRALTLQVEAVLAPGTSVYDVDPAARELVPDAGAVSATFARLERDRTVDQIEDEVARWAGAV